MDGLVYRGRKLVEVGAAGGLAGLLAGGVGVGVLTIWCLAAGAGPLAMQVAVGHAVLGRGAPWWTACGAGAATLAAALVTFGVGFALFVRSGTRPVTAGALGVPWGLLAWALCTGSLAPDATPELLALARTVPTGWFASFAAAGAALAVLPSLQRRLLIAAMPRRPLVLVRGNGVKDSRSAGS